MTTELLDLKNSVENALDWIKRAENILGNMLTDQRTGEPLPWKEAELSGRCIGTARVVLGLALDPLADTIKEEEAYADEMSDRADGQSY